MEQPKSTSMNKSVVEGVTSHAIKNGDSVAVYDGTTKLTYKDLICWATALSEEIEALPDPESPIGIFLPSSAAYIVAILALLMAGRTSVPMNDSHPEERNRRIIGRSRLRSAHRRFPDSAVDAPDRPNFATGARFSGAPADRCPVSTARHRLARPYFHDQLYLGQYR